MADDGSDSKGKSDPSGIVIPFGKHKGHTVDQVLTDDPGYADWLLGQGWLAERFADLHAAITSRGAGTDDTPEHNALQARFLDDSFRMALVLAADPESISQKAKNDYAILTERNRWRHPEDRANKPSVYDIAMNARLFTKLVAFEFRGIDVIVERVFSHKDKPEFEGLPSDWRWLGQFSRYLTVEIKPSLGDDFPTVIRQMKRLDARYLLVGSYSGRAVPLPSLRQMFEVNGMVLVTVQEVEAEIPNARALIAVDTTA